MRALLVWLALAAIGRPDLAAVDPCRSVTADATTTLGEHDDADVLASGNIAFSYDEHCPRFVADFKVQPAASPASKRLGPTFRVAGGPTADSHRDNENVCAALRVETAVYKKVAGASAFELVAKASYAGSWSPRGEDRCVLTRRGTEPAPATANPAGPDVWRVVVDATIQGIRVPVTASIAFVPRTAS